MRAAVGVTHARGCWSNSCARLLEWSSTKRNVRGSAGTRAEDLGGAALGEATQAGTPPFSATASWVRTSTVALHASFFGTAPGRDAPRQLFSLSGPAAYTSHGDDNAISESETVGAGRSQATV